MIGGKRGRTIPLVVPQRILRSGFSQIARQSVCGEALQGQDPLDLDISDSCSRIWGSKKKNTKRAVLSASSWCPPGRPRRERFLVYIRRNRGLQPGVPFTEFEASWQGTRLVCWSRQENSKSFTWKGLSLFRPTRPRKKRNWQTFCFWGQASVTKPDQSLDDRRGFMPFLPLEPFVFP